MVRRMLCSLCVLSLCAVLAVAADKEKKTDTKDKNDKKHKEAKITKIDAKKGTVTVKMADKNGKDVEKTFKLAEEARYMDSTGKVVAVDVFTSGDEVLIVEAEGKVKEMKKKDKTDTAKKSDKDKTTDKKSDKDKKDK